MKPAVELARSATLGVVLLAVPLVTLGLLGRVPLLVDAIALAVSVGGGSALVVYLPGSWRELALAPVVGGLGGVAVASASGPAPELVAGIAGVGVLVWRAGAGPGGRRVDAVVLGAASTPILGVALTVVVAALAPSPTAYVGVAAAIAAAGLVLAAAAVLIRVSADERAIPS